MPTYLNNVIKKSDWIKLAILIIVGASAISLVYSEYKKTLSEYQKTISSAISETEKLYK